MQPPNPRIIKQSSTESGHSNRISTHSSSDAAVMAPHSNRFRQQGGREQQQPPGGQSWHGTPRTDSNRRGGAPGRHVSSGVGDSQSTTLPRRNPASGDVHHRLQQEAGGSNSLDGTMKKRRSAGVGGVNYGEVTYQNSTAIPLIEFNLVNGSPSNSPGMRGENFSSTAANHREIDPLNASGPSGDDVFYHQSNRDTIINHNPKQRTLRGQSSQNTNNPNKAYIKYNSFANY